MSFSSFSQSIENEVRRTSGSLDDYDTSSAPGGVIERNKRRSRHGNINGPDLLPDLVGSNVTDDVYLITQSDNEIGWRKWLVAPYCFLYIAGYITSSATFGLFVYYKVQRDLYPDLDQLNETSACKDVNKSSLDYQRQVHVQDVASNWGIYTSLAVGIPAIFANMLLGSSTDKFGRKFLFFLPCIGTLIRMIVTVNGIYFDFNLTYHLIGFIVEGLTGQLFTMLLVCFTYVADVTSQKGKTRALGITMIELAIGVAVAGFSFSTGYFIQNTGFFYPMLSAGIMLAMSLVVVIFIPESFPPAKRDNSESVVTKMKTAYDLYLGSFNRGRRWKYNTLLSVFTFTMFSALGRGSVEPLFQLGEPFCWSSEKLGQFTAARSLMQQICGMGLIKVFQKFMTDESIAIMGCISFTIGYVIEGLASSDALIYTVPFVSACGLLTVPMCRALLSKLTRSDQQGAVFAVIATMETLVNLCGSLLSIEIYVETLNLYRGFVFFVYGACSAFCLLQMILYKKYSNKTTPLVKR